MRPAETVYRNPGTPTENPAIGALFMPAHMLVHRLMKEIVDFSIHSSARVIVVKAIATFFAMALQGVLIGALFERFS